MVAATIAATAASTAASTMMLLQPYPCGHAATFAATSTSTTLLVVAAVNLAATTASPAVCVVDTSIADFSFQKKSLLK